jgi:hypothetical protein
MIKYTRKDWKKIPEEVQRMLDSVKEYGTWEGEYHRLNHEDIARRLMREDKLTPFSVIILTEFLDEAHENDEKYVIKEEVEIVSELEEAWIKLLDKDEKIIPEINQYERKHDVDRDTAIGVVREKHLSQLIEGLRDKYEEWEEPFDEEKIKQLRTETETNRRYNVVPELFNWGFGGGWFQQYFIIPEERLIISGSGAGSGTRENHNRYGLAFNLFDREIKRIPTYLFVYDKHNQFNFVDRLDRFCLVYRELGSNYHLSRYEMEPILKDTSLLVWDLERNIELKTFKELNLI